MRQGESQRFAHHLRTGGRAEKVTPAARRSTHPARQHLGVFERNFASGKSGPDRLSFARILPVGRRQGDAARDQDARQVVKTGQGHHNGRQALVAGGHAQDAFGRGDRASLAAENGGGVVPIGQAVEHAGRTLGASVAGIGTVGRVGHGAGHFELIGGRFQGQSQLEAAGVMPHGDGPTVLPPDSAHRAEHYELRAGQGGGIPAHASVFGHSKCIAAGPMAKHFGRKG